ncbi:MAG: M56 family metallopeptidase [Lawsonibacter sp.]|jgi:beta-lactamase regulating signal transducer with metallopeptidase domain
MIEWAVTSSVLILVVLVMRQCLKGKISLRLQYGLWALVLLRLLVPVSVGSTTWSVLNAVEGIEQQASTLVIEYMESEPPELPIADPNQFISLGEPQGQERELWKTENERGSPTSMETVLMAIWGVGAIGMGLWLLWVNTRFGEKLRRSRKSMGVEECPLPVYVTGAVQTPCLFGLFRPSIYVTEEVAGNETILRHSIAHELTHYRHRDHLWATLRGLSVALHWYNPLVWMAAAISRSDGELCCDEATVQRLGEGERAAYGRTLLAVTCQGRANSLLTATSMTGSGRGIKERIVLLAKRPKTAVYTLVGVIFIVAVAVGCTFTGQEKEGSTDEMEITIGEGINVPQAVSDYARAYIRSELTYYMEHEITGVEIVGLTPISTGSASENSGLSMYLLEYRVRVADPDQVVLAGGMSMEDGAITEWGSAGQPYLLLYWEDDDEGQTHWEEISVLHTDTIIQNYGTPELLEKYGNEYTAAAMERYLEHIEATTPLAFADLDLDGEDESITVRKVSEEVWQLVVTKQDGTELLCEDAGLPHLAWNSVYLYTDSQNRSSLLRYNPAMATGLAHFSYTLFTLEGGEETVLEERSLDFELSETSEKVEEIVAFADQVNNLLRRSTLLLSTQDSTLIIGPESMGAHQEHLDDLEGFLNQEELAAYQAAFAPELMEEGQLTGQNSVSAFFTSYYQKPEELNFEEFLQYFPDDGLVPDDPDNPEFQALTNHPLWPYQDYQEGDFIPTPIHRYTRENVDSVLERYAGITTQELVGNISDTSIYLKEYDAWYNFTSDYGPGTFYPAYGLREGNVVRLWEQAHGNETPGDVLTLEETEDGFRILSHLPGTGA